MKDDEMKKMRDEKREKLVDDLAKAIGPHVRGANPTEAQLKGAVRLNLVNILTEVSESILDIQSQQTDESMRKSEEAEIEEGVNKFGLNS